MKLVLTLTGPDRVGIVDELTSLLLECHGNVESSRMARLGGEFASLMLVSMPDQSLDRLKNNTSDLIAQGFKVTISPTQPSPNLHTGWLPYQIEVSGADHEGIIHEIAHHLSTFGINIEEMETSTSHAPVSGTPFFNMRASIISPPNLSEESWQNDLDEIGHRLNVDIQVTAL
jgi:glycine cleavage system transcriptional repressor